MEIGVKQELARGVWFVSVVTYDQPDRMTARCFQNLPKRGTLVTLLTRPLPTSNGIEGENTIDSHKVVNGVDNDLDEEIKPSVASF